MTPGPAGAISRITAIDAVRGLAVLGILLMNIVAFAMPIAAYDDPTAYGGAQGADMVAWMLAFAVADGKMRGLFTMLFGVSMAIVADGALARGADPAVVHYRRMGWLLVIGMLHGTLIWYGDILVEYALTGAILFAAWRWRPVALFYAAAVLFVADLAMAWINWRDLIALHDRAMQPGARGAVRAAWQAFASPDPAPALAEIVGYRGGLATISATRLSDLGQLQAGLPIYLIESVGTASLGLALYRLGYFTRWPAAWHRWLLLAGLAVALPLSLAVAVMIAQSGFAPEAMAFGAMLSRVLRPAMTLGLASAIILLIEAGPRGWVASRLAATGRMALSNYLMTSVVMTTIFYGHGLGLFATLSRAQLYPLVAAMWLAMLLWSKPWLARFQFGPVEWAWRSLARWQVQPWRRRQSRARGDIATDPQ